MHNQQHLVLASSSPRRLELLNKINIFPDVVYPADIDETPKKKEEPYAYVKRISQEKALSAKEKYEDSYIIAADTSVIRGTQILGKPQDKAQAESFLKLLSGGKHKVLTAFSVSAPNNKKIITKVVKTAITLKRLSLDEMTWYLNSNEWQGKSGGYGIQGKFEVFVKQINGSVSNVVGLPIFNVYNTLTGLGYKFNYQESSHE
ncbi:MAG: Maf family protein [Alphaproteobacteria bacterium]|jgi:septum formation protein|nr:Maf family protein [Alphaproteobacteria bacterium]